MVPISDAFSELSLREFIYSLAASTEQESLYISKWRQFSPVLESRAWFGLQPWFSKSSVSSTLSFSTLSIRILEFWADLKSILFENLRICLATLEKFSRRDNSSGVWPKESSKLGLAPSLSKLLTITRSFLITAMWRAVRPSS